MKLKTGFGYYVKDGKKLHKFELDPTKDHPDPKGFTVVEVADKAALDQIVLDHSEEELARIQDVARKTALRESGKEKLKSFGLTNDEIEAMIG